jgi:urea transport system permease protein
MTTAVQAEAPMTKGRWRFRVLSEDGAAVAFFAGLVVLPVFVAGYPIYILPQYMLYGLLAMSLGLIWGFGGIVSFGQAAFFALGAYAMGLSLNTGIGFINPAYLGLLAAILVGGAVAAFASYFLFTAGVRATYFVLITLALSIIVEQLAVSQSQITGGWNGMFINRMELTFGPLGAVSLFGDVPMYYFILVIVLGCYVLARWMLSVKFGKVLQGIRENEDRMEALGYNTAIYKTLAFTFSGGLAGLAGALYGTHASFVSPSIAGVLFSTQVVVWVAIGGRNVLLGALLGGLGVAYAANLLSAATPTYWQLILGLVFILVIVFLKGGIAGALDRLIHRQEAGRWQ